MVSSKQTARSFDPGGLRALNCVCISSPTKSDFVLEDGWVHILFLQHLTNWDNLPLSKVLLQIPSHAGLGIMVMRVCIGKWK